MQVGDIVEAVGAFRLACGSGVYPHAVVVGTDPIVLVSIETDMLWHATLSPGCVKTIARAKDSVIDRCADRYRRDIAEGRVPEQRTVATDKPPECGVRLANSEMIQSQLLSSLSDKSKVAIVLDVDDLSELLDALRRVYGRTPKQNSMMHDLRQLKNAAFPAISP